MVRIPVPKVAAAHTCGYALGSAKLLVIEQPFEALGLLLEFLQRLRMVALRSLTLGLRLIGRKRLLLLWR